MTDPDRSPVTVLTGCYTPGTGGRGAGVTVLRRDPASGALTALGVTPAVSPSYLAPHPSGRAVYAVAETEPEGRVAAFALNGDTPRPLGDVSSGGAAPCHLAVDPTGRFVVAANYGDGTVSVHRLGDDLAIAATTDVIAADGDGPVTGRQEGPHAHQIVFLPGRGLLAVVDLGADEVRHHRLDPGTGRLTAGPVLRLPPGTGPRHMALAPGGRAYLVGELRPVVIPLVLRAHGHLRVAGPETAVGGPGPNAPSAIAVSPDGRFVYVANRGPDTVSVLAAGAAGLREVARVPAGGAHPRDLVLAGDHAYTAAQNGDVVTVFRRDAATGMLHATGAAYHGGSPTCVLPLSPRRAGEPA